MKMGCTYLAANYSRIQNCTKLMVIQSPSTLVKCVKYLIVISTNINENYRSKRKFVKKIHKNKSTREYTHISELFYQVIQHSND